MKRGGLWGFGVLITVASVGAAAAVLELDEDFMRGVEDTSKALADDIGVHSAREGGEHARELTDMFAQVEDYYAAKGDAPDAVSIAHKSRELTAEIAKLVASGDFDDANVKATDVARNCKSCHNFYKKS